MSARVVKATRAFFYGFMLVVLSVVSLDAVAAPPTCPSGQGPRLELSSCSRNTTSTTLPTCPAPGTLLSSNNVLSEAQTLFTGQCNATPPAGSYTFRDHVAVEDTQARAFCDNVSPPIRGWQVHLNAVWVCKPLPPPSCEVGRDAGFIIGSGAQQVTRCDVQRCEIRRDRLKIVDGSRTGNTDLYIGHYVMSGQECGSPDANPPTKTPDPVPTEGGDFLPDNADQGRNCGTFNGVRKCLDAPSGNGSCTSLPSGGVFCVTAPLTGPADVPPDNGTPGTPAQGQEVASEYQTAAGAVTNVTTVIYNQTTVNNSTNYGAGAGDPGGDEGEGEGEGDPDLEEPTDGDGTFSTPSQQYGFDDNAQGIADAKADLAAAMNTIKGEIAETFGTVSGGAGSLPVWQFASPLGGTIVFDFAQFETQLSVLASALLLISFVVAFFIITGD